MWALVLEATHPGLATDVVYVAGDRVVTDPLCKPFSMGRNLFCVHRCARARLRRAHSQYQSLDRARMTDRT